MKIVMKIYKYGIYAACLGSLLTLGGCLNLDETPYSEITEESYVPTEADAVSLLATAYSPLRYIMDWQGLFDLEEEPGDVIVTPVRPNGWDDGGTYRRMHLHTWDDREWQPQNTYEHCFTGINNVNKVLKKADEGFFPDKIKTGVVAELRAVRALWYSILCDNFGNVPIVTTFSADIPTQSTRQQVYDFVVSELNAAILDLESDVNTSTYGRLTQWGARCLLARMYLNAEVYTGTPHWKEALDQCNLIINSGKYSLASSYLDIFKTDNSSCPEIIFAVPYDEVYNSGSEAFGAHMKFLDSQHRLVFKMQSTPWNGSAANPQFINSYDPADKRMKQSWLQGDQINATTGAVQFTLTNKIPSMYKSDYHDGYRIGKYEIKVGAKSRLSNDFPYFRYAEVLLMKAECLMRLGQDEQVAADLVSQVRARSFDDPAKAKVTIADLKADSKIKYGILDENGNVSDPGNQTPVKFGGIYDEYGWEMCAEAYRRTEMIRFGTYSTKSWFNHQPITDGHTQLFPIAYTILNTNSNLKQNPGY